MDESLQYVLIHLTVKINTLYPNRDSPFLKGFENHKDGKSNDIIELHLLLNPSSSYN